MEVTYRQSEFECKLESLVGEYAGKMDKAELVESIEWVLSVLRNADEQDIEWAEYEEIA